MVRAMHVASDASSGVDLRSAPASSKGRAALVIAHPGHELTVHGWLERERPQVFVLTDGSGRSGVARLQSTTKVILAAGARTGSIYGRLPENAVYRALLGGDTGLFVSLAEELAEALVQGGFDRVAGDMEEGFNPVHDIWRMVVNAAVAIVKCRTGLEMPNYDFSLFRRQDAHDLPGRAGTRLELDEGAFMRKLATARAYPELAPEVVAVIEGTMDDPILGDLAIREKVRQVLGSFGMEAFRIEYFRQLQSANPRGDELAPDPPFYEVYGEVLVAAGRYKEVLRHRAHLLPVAEALRRLTTGEGGAQTSAAAKA